MARRRLRPPPALIGLAALTVLLGTWCAAFDGVRDTLRERTFDLVLPLLPDAAANGPDIAIVDIDRTALARFGPWPWPRARLARLVDAVAAAEPAAIGLDILLAGPDRFSPASLLAETGNARLADGLPDGDALLGAALAGAPSALGFVLDSATSAPDLPATPILERGAVSVPDIWRAAGLLAPAGPVAAGAQGFGALVAAADRDGPIRRVPLLVQTGAVLRPGLAVETVRLAQGAGTLLIDAAGRLHAGGIAVPLGADAALRLVARSPEAWRARTVGAADLLDDPAAGRRRLAGRIVLIGGSAPELGGLRVTPASAATPSVLIQAAAVEALQSTAMAWRPAWLGWAEAIGALGLGLFGVLAAARLRPGPAILLALAAGAGWAAAAVAAAPIASLLVDPAGPALIGLGSFAVAALARFTRDEWRARRLRARFEQHLAPDVVRRIAADPGALRLSGELREITALFADIEGFTAMTERAEPVELVALLDAYFDAVADAVTEHGGMIDKIIGDGVHAIFNAPFSLDAHPARAVACALALLAATEAIRRTPLGQRLALGRTRIGIETGPAIVGDVGGRRKLDYTAHGNAVNTAARLEAANKTLASSICIGPGTAARLDPATVRRIGTLTLRGQSRPVEIFTLAGLAGGA